MHRIASRLFLYASPEETSVINILARLSEQMPVRPASWQRPSYDWILSYRLQARRILSFDRTCGRRTSPFCWSRMTILSPGPAPKDYGIPPCGSWP